MKTNSRIFTGHVARKNLIQCLALGLLAFVLQGCASARSGSVRYEPTRSPSAFDRDFATEKAPPAGIAFLSWNF